jgi:hypothetical protein
MPLPLNRELVVESILQDSLASFKHQISPYIIVYMVIVIVVGKVDKWIRFGDPAISAICVP